VGAGAGAEVTTRLELQEAFRMVPPTDEEIQKLLEVDSPEALQRTVRERIGEAKKLRENGRIETALLERILSEQQMELPERMVEAQMQSRQHARRQELETEGLAEEEVTAELERQQEEIKTAVTRGVKAFFLIQAIAADAGLKIENQDLVAELKDIARRNDATYEEVRDYYREKGLVEQVGIELLERKVRILLRAKAEITTPR
jgi:trigger factor